MQTEHVNLKDVNLVGALMTLMAMGVMCMSAFTCLATLAFGYMEESFYKTARTADATVSFIEEKRYTDAATVRDGGYQQNNIRYHQVITLVFEDDSGERITAKASDGEMTLLSVGDVVPIYYSPENSRDVRFVQDKKNVSALNIVSIVSGVLAVCLFLGLVMNARRKKMVK